MKQMWVVPHSHWDREWYEPHDVFRARLVHMMDGLLDLLARDRQYRFTLDGQMAMVEDYLAIRPERREDFVHAVTNHQISVGPWLILLDEFSCDGEAIIRNLELGIAGARALGGEMKVGYLPDMFGHCAQMPQILRGFGIADACLWRGVPQAVDEHAFRWTAPNGDSVRVEYLWDSYGNALKLFEPVHKMAEFIGDYATTHSNWFRGEDIAGWYGTDHMEPRADLVEIVEAFNRQSTGLTLRIGTVSDVVEARAHDRASLQGLIEVHGELRSHARGNLLPGVMSIRTAIKAAMADAERESLIAERLNVVVPTINQAPLLNRAWRLIVESSAHDSANGCGHDATADQVENRLHIARHTARGALDLSLRKLATCTPRGALAVFNPSGWSRRVQAEMVTSNFQTGTVQILERLPTLCGDEVMTSDELPKLLRRIHGQELFGGQIMGWAWEDHELTIDIADQSDGDFDLSLFTAELRRRLAERPDGRWRVVTRRPQTARVLVSTDVEGLATAVVSPATSKPPSHPVAVRQDTLDNGLVKVQLRPDGLIDITELVTQQTVTGALQLIDEGDCGDAYNYGPISATPVVPSTTLPAEVLADGPFRGQIRYRRVLHLPSGLDQSRRGRLADVVCQEVDTVLELREGEPFVRVRLEWVNQVRDHRLRICIPTLHAGLEQSTSTGQYGVTTRGRTAEGGWGEYPIPTFPAYRNVVAGDVGVVLDRLTEYEIISTDGSDQIALTLMRAVGMMSVNVHPWRDEPAGAEIPTPGAQYLGRRLETNFAVVVGVLDAADEQFLRHTDALWLEPVTVMGTGVKHDLQPLGIRCEGAVPVESVRRVGDCVELRAVNYSQEPRKLRLVSPYTWNLCTMGGDLVEAKVDAWSLDIPAGSIVTLRSNDAARH